MPFTVTITRISKGYLQNSQEEKSATVPLLQNMGGIHRFLTRDFPASITLPPRKEQGSRVPKQMFRCVHTSCLWESLHAGGAGGSPQPPLAENRRSLGTDFSSSFPGWRPKHCQGSTAHNWKFTTDVKMQIKTR